MAFVTQASLPSSVAPSAVATSSRSSAIHGASVQETCSSRILRRSPQQKPLSPSHARFRTTIVRAVAVDSPEQKKAPKLSRVEGLKIASNHLRLPLHDELGNSEIFITENAVQIMKFHGSYQQDDREQRAPGQQKKYQFMLRLKMPAGEFPAAVYKTLDDLSDDHGNGTLRATTRCSFQMHGILKGDLKTVFSAIMNSGSATVGACGDLSRNVMATPAPFVSKPYAHVRFVSKVIAELFAPQTAAFSEIWLDGEKAATLEYWKRDIDMDAVQAILRHDNGRNVVFPDNEEPIYGDTYLPRKFKFAVTVPGDNSIDIYTQDVGLVLISDSNGDPLGYNVIVGGGMGRTHQKQTTFPRLGDHLGYVPAEKIWDLCKAIVATQRDHGNREQRANARMKYLVDKLGIDAFRKLVETYFGEEIEPFRELIPWKYEDWLGWHDQGDGNLFLGLFIENGRVKDTDGHRLKTALRCIVDTFGFDMVITPNQNIIFKNIRPDQKLNVESVLKEHGVKLADEYDMNLRLSMACPALPLCGLAVTEAERHMPAVVSRMNALFARTGVESPIVMRMTGCPNGCARPYMAEIGFVGSGPEAYQLWLGGCPNQTRLAFPLLDKVKDNELENVLEPILVSYKSSVVSDTTKSHGGEAFGDYCSRLGKTRLLDLVQCWGKDDVAVLKDPLSDDSSLEKTVEESRPDEAKSGSDHADEDDYEDSKSKLRPRLTVSSEIMSRLKVIAEVRDMTPSQLANEIISKYLSSMNDER